MTQSEKNDIYQVNSIKKLNLRIENSVNYVGQITQTRFL